MNESEDKVKSSYREKAEAERESRIARLEQFLSNDGRSDSDNADCIPADTERTGGTAVTEKTGAVKKSVIKKPEKRAEAGNRAASEKVNIHEGHRKRMRESARRDPEFETFSDIQILEYLLAFATPRRDTNPIAHALLDKFGSLLSVFLAPAEELVKVKGVTVAAAEIISMMTKICVWDGKRDIRLYNAAEAAEYFGSIFLAGDSAGVCVAYLDRNFEVIAAERFDASRLELKPIVGAACRHGADYVLMSMRHDAFPDMHGISDSVDSLAHALSLVGIKFIDCLMFTDYGYYSQSPVSGQDGAEFVFYPYRMFVGSPEFVTRRLDSDEEHSPVSAEVDYLSFVRGTGFDPFDAYAEVAADKTE